MSKPLIMAAPWCGCPAMPVARRVLSGNTPTSQPRRNWTSNGPGHGDPPCRDARAPPPAHESGTPTPEHGNNSCLAMKATGRPMAQLSRGARSLPWLATTPQDPSMRRWPPLNPTVNGQAEQGVTMVRSNPVADAGAPGRNVGGLQGGEVGEAPLQQPRGHGPRPDVQHGVDAQAGHGVHGFPPVHPGDHLLHQVGLEGGALDFPQLAVQGR